MDRPRSPSQFERRPAAGYVPLHARAPVAPPPREQLGEALVDRGLLTADQLEWALDAHRRTGERLGRVLLAAGLVRRQTLYSVLAELWGCGFVDLVHTPPDAAVAGLFDPEQMALEGWIPLDPARRGAARCHLRAALAGPAAAHPSRVPTRRRERHRRHHLRRHHRLGRAGRDPGAVRPRAAARGGIRALRARSEPLGPGRPVPMAASRARPDRRRPGRGGHPRLPARF